MTCRPQPLPVKILQGRYCLREPCLHSEVVAPQGGGGLLPEPGFSGAQHLCPEPDGKQRSLSPFPSHHLSPRHVSSYPPQPLGSTVSCDPFNSPSSWKGCPLSLEPVALVAPCTSLPSVSSNPGLCLGRRNNSRMCI